MSKLSVKALKEKCNDLGLSKCGNKDELVKRIESFSCKDDNNMKVIKWKKRGRKVATRPSETVGNESDDTDDEEVSVDQNMKKHELREECVKRNLPASGAVKCIIKRLKENDDLKEELKKDQPNVEKLCESCLENPGKLFESPASK